MSFVGDDWAEDHHDVYIMTADGATLASRRLREGLTGIAAQGSNGLLGQYFPTGTDLNHHLGLSSYLCKRLWPFAFGS
jgi:hypothetical protein